MCSILLRKTPRISMHKSFWSTTGTHNLDQLTDISMNLLTIQAKTFPQIPVCWTYLTLSRFWTICILNCFAMCNLASLIPWVLNISLPPLWWAMVVWEDSRVPPLTMCCVECHVLITILHSLCLCHQCFPTSEQNVPVICVKLNKYQSCSKIMNACHSLNHWFLHIC